MVKPLDARADEHVITLVAGDGVNLRDVMRQVTLPFTLARTLWFADHNAVDVFYPEQNLDSLRAAMVEIFYPHQVDVLAQVAAYRLKKVVVMDMESTVIQEEMLDQLADCVGKYDEVSAMTQQAMAEGWDFATSVQKRVALLRGLRADAIAETAKCITHSGGIADLMRDMKQSGATCWLATGGFTCFADDVGTALGFDKVIANKLIIRDGVIAGEVAQPIRDGNTKLQALHDVCRERDVDMRQSLTAGDGSNDLPMLMACHAAGGLAVAYKAKDKVRKAIPNQINFSDFRALRYAQGFMPHL